MKDTTKLLNFDPDRKLLFKEFRRVGIQLRRKLTFDSDRNLSFDSTRNLGFGKEGVTFRHFACGNCGTVVDGSAPKCPNCGAWFVTEEQQVRSDTQVNTSTAVVHSVKRCPPRPRFNLLIDKRARGAPLLTVCVNSQQLADFELA